MEHTELLIVGAGAAGLSAARTALDCGCRDLLIVDRNPVPGGVLPQCLHEGFGLASFGVELTGPAYAARLAEGLEGVRFCFQTELLSISPQRRARLSGPEGLAEIAFDRLILAAGSRERSIGSLPVAGTRPAGVFTAGEAQELINLRGWLPGKRAVVLGAGDLGLIIARRLLLSGAQVLAVLEQEAAPTAMTRNIRRCLEEHSLPLRCRTTLRKLHGEGRLSAVTVEDLDSGARETIACDTLITAAGLIPEQSLLAGLDDPPWLRLCGNCRRIHDIADSAAAEAAAVTKEFLNP